MPQIVYFPTFLFAQPSRVVLKGDYLILEYGRRVMLEIEESFSIVPTRGATGMDEIIGLLRGWAMRFTICLDADAEGKKAVKNYRDSWGMSAETVFDLSEIAVELDGKSIEGFFGKRRSCYCGKILRSEECAVEKPNTVIL